MIDLEREKENFKNHKAIFTDYGNIKILDFKNPNSNEYRIRFLFEQDYCRLHISGDLGELVAVNYNNIGYFNEKISCHDRRIYTYDEAEAKKDLKEILEEEEILDDILKHDRYDWETDEDKLDEFYDSVLEDFSEDTGISSKGYDVLSGYLTDAWEFVGNIGKQPTGILNLYMLAFKLAMQQLS